MAKKIVILVLLSITSYILFTQYLKYFTYDTPAIYRVVLDEQHLTDIDRDNQKIIEVISNQQPYEFKVQVTPQKIDVKNDPQLKTLKDLTQLTYKTLTVDIEHSEALKRDADAKSLERIKKEKSGDSIEYALYLQTLLKENGYSSKLVYGHVLGKHYFHFWVEVPIENRGHIQLDPFNNKVGVDNRYVRLKSDSQWENVLGTMRLTHIGIERINW